MIPITRACDCENINDFCRYYGGGWIGWHEQDSDTITPYYVGRMASAEHIALRPLIKDGDGRFHMDGEKYITWRDLNARIDFGVPDIGMTPEGPTVQFCAYSTPRQARKGYRASELSYAEFNGWDIRKVYPRRGRGEKYDWVWFSFNPEYKKLEEANRILDDGERVGVPLSRTLAVYSSDKCKLPLLAYKRWTVGYVINPDLISIREQYRDYLEPIEQQTGAKVIVA